MPKQPFDAKRMRYADHHLFIDIEYSSKPEIEISIASVLHKVVIAASWTDFLEVKDCNLAEFKNVFYSTLSFTMENYTKYQGSPFEPMTAIKFKDQLKKLVNDEERAHKEKLKNYDEEEREDNDYDDNNMSSKTRSRKKVQDFLRVYDDQYKEGNDEVKCMDPDIPYKRGEYDEEAAKIPLQIVGPGRQRKLIVDELDIEFQRATIKANNDMISQNQSMAVLTEHRYKRDYSKSNRTMNSKGKSKRKAPIKVKDILAQNKKAIPQDVKDEMRKICDLLGIRKGVHIAVTIYGYSTHLLCYKDIKKIAMMDNVPLRKNYVQNLNTNKLRDIKSKIGSSSSLSLSSTSSTFIRFLFILTTLLFLL